MPDCVLIDGPADRRREFHTDPPYEIKVAVQTRRLRVGCCPIHCPPQDAFDTARYLRVAETLEGTFVYCYAR